ncbi:hypothetical protein EON64_08600 [archaeon]|nr:MAG: hypothetical protein EON64_08600 [archaeon]
MSLNELSRRMETLVEQILPFAPVEEADSNVEFQQDGESKKEGAPKVERGGRSQPVAVTGQVRHVPHQSSVWAETGDFVPSYDRLGQFYRKYNKILLDNIAIQKEKERLALENAQLEDLIAQYLEGLQVSDHVLSGENPLFVVNGRGGLNHDPPVRRIKPTIQDAVQIRNTAARQFLPVNK